MHSCQALCVFFNGACFFIRKILFCKRMKCIVIPCECNQRFVCFNKCVISFVIISKRNMPICFFCCMNFWISWFINCMCYKMCNTLKVGMCWSAYGTLYGREHVGMELSLSCIWYGRPGSVPNLPCRMSSYFPSRYQHFWRCDDVRWVQSRMAFFHFSLL